MERGSRVGSYLKRRKRKVTIDVGYERFGRSGLLRLVRLFEAQKLVDDLRHIVLAYFHVTMPFRPDHHVGPEVADI